MMTLKAQLLTVSETFAASTSLSESRISTMVFNDGKVLARLRGGADVTTGVPWSGSLATGLAKLIGRQE